MKKKLGLGCLYTLSVKMILKCKEKYLLKPLIYITVFTLFTLFTPDSDEKKKKKKFFWENPYSVNSVTQGPRSEIKIILDYSFHMCFTCKY